MIDNKSINNNLIQLYPYIGKIPIYLFDENPIITFLNPTVALLLLEVC